MNIFILYFIIFLAAFFGLVIGVLIMRDSPEKIDKRTQAWISSHKDTLECACNNILQNPLYSENVLELLIFESSFDICMRY
jgi:uncharacterized membrane-anchored protein YhcB (DUF1043 family)